jgi:hypothetical protein
VQLLLLLLQLQRVPQRLLLLAHQGYRWQQVLLR